jgi:zinc transporter ZupT
MLQITPETGLLVVAYLLIPAVVGYWIYRDASNRGTRKALNWALALFLFGLLNPLALAVGVVLYLSVREEFSEAANSNESGD